uniref:Uncharacterized protein n=1 Tax=Romanomermis culicivorax TaxID=13658 RepID=A0A915IE30_ROMCU
MALRYILQCLTDTRAPNYPATEERKVIIRDIHRKYQMEMNKKAEIKKKKLDNADKTSCTAQIPNETSTDYRPNYDDATTNYWNSNVVRSLAMSSRATSTDH